MGFYRVRNPEGVATWLAYHDAEKRVWSYVHATEKFRLNPGVYLDFYFENRNTYEPIDNTAGRRAVRDGLGALNPVARLLLRRFRDDTAARSVAQ